MDLIVNTGCDWKCVGMQQMERKKGQTGMNYLVWSNKKHSFFILKHFATMMWPTEQDPDKSELYVLCSVGTKLFNMNCSILTHK